MEQPATPTLDRMQAPHTGAWTRRGVGKMDPVTGEYPEGYEPCRLVDHSNLIGSFLDWLDTQGIRLARYMSPVEVELVVGGFDEAIDILVPEERSKQRLLADFFEIDENEAERERRAILEWLRTKSDDG
jgi:hypothetical protein